MFNHPTLAGLIRKRRYNCQRIAEWWFSFKWISNREIVSLNMVKSPVFLLSLAGHFASGLFATLMATPCSAPFQGVALGFALGEGRTLAEALASSRGVCEGVSTAPEIVGIARALKVEAPVCEAVAAILAGGSTPAAQMAELLGRPLKSE